MIKTVCEMTFGEIDYVSLKCKRCKGEFHYQSIDRSLKGCPICNLAWEQEEVEAVRELSNAYRVLSKANDMKNFTLGFVSVEEK